MCFQKNWREKKTERGKKGKVTVFKKMKETFF